MTAEITSQSPVRGTWAAPGKRDWLRWILAGFPVLVVTALKLEAAPAPLALPASAAAPAGP